MFEQFTFSNSVFLSVPQHRVVFVVALPCPTSSSRDPGSKHVCKSRSILTSSLKQSTRARHWPLLLLRAHYSPCTRTTPDSPSCPRSASSARESEVPRARGPPAPSGKPPVAATTADHAAPGTPNYRRWRVQTGTRSWCVCGGVRGMGVALNGWASVTGYSLSGSGYLLVQ